MYFVDPRKNKSSPSAVRLTSASSSLALAYSISAMKPMWWRTFCSHHRRMSKPQSSGCRQHCRRSRHSSTFCITKRLCRPRRGKGGQETRLHGLYSVGVGGHISEEDHGLFTKQLGYEEGMRRELMEEVAIEDVKEIVKRDTPHTEATS